MSAFATKHSDVIVVGTGAVGSAAMYYLAKNGVDVIGLDRFPVAHDKGSSHGQTRIIRLAYFEHPNYVPLLKRSFELWEELEKVSGIELYTESGLIQVGPPDGEIVAGVRESAAMHNLTVEDVTQSDLKDFYPGFSIPHGMEAVFENRAGFLKVEKCIETFFLEMHFQSTRTPSIPERTHLNGITRSSPNFSRGSNIPIMFNLRFSERF